MLLHSCLLRAFGAVNSSRVQNWNVEDSKQFLGKCSGLIFQCNQKGLWRDEKEAFKAKEVFYWWRDCLPATSLQSKAETMLKFLSNENERFFIVTTEYKHLMFREVANCWGAAHARGFAGSVPGKELLSVSEAVSDILEQALSFNDPIAFVASKEEEQIARKYGWEFIEANSENFELLSE